MIDYSRNRPTFNTIYDDSTPRHRVPYQHHGANAYMSGRWHRRDGDTYGNIPPQPPIELAEPKGANHTAGDLRSPAVRRD